MTLQEIIQYNEECEIEIDKFELHISNLKASLKNINSLLNLDDIKQLSYQEAKNIHKLLYWNTSDLQRQKIETIVKELKENEYPLLKKAHYYPVINEMNFLGDDQKNRLDKLLRDCCNSYIYTDSLGWLRLKFKKEITDKVFEFLLNKGIVEKSYIIKCDCGSDECYGETISQERYDEFVKYHSVTKEDKLKMSKEELDKYSIDWSDKGYIQVGCWNDDAKEIYDLKTFMNEVKLFAYKNVVKPDLSLENV